MTKSIVLNADDFGLSKAINKAVLESYEAGILKSVSIVANGEAFEDAIVNVLPQCSDLGVGVHLNIAQGNSLCTDLTVLTDSEGKFKNDFVKIFFMSYNPKEKIFFEELEREFRRQIELVMSKTTVTHIDSHLHLHSIPKIFDLVCRLAKEYGIKHVRTHFEKPYFVPNLQKYCTCKYYKNIFKLILFNLFTLFNEATVHRFGLQTNDYSIGILYNTMMDALTISYGVMAVNYKNTRLEVILHPCRYDDGTINNNFDEYLSIKNKKLRDKIEKLGFDITNYVEKEV